MVAERNPSREINHTDPLSPNPPTTTPDDDEGVGRRAIWQEASTPFYKRRPDALWWTRRFAGTPDQVRGARRFVAELLADSPNADDAAWVAGELATNAIRHSHSGRPGECFEVEVVRTLTRAEICVIDAGGENTPHICGPDDQPTGGSEVSECGRGLYGIGGLVTRYGTYLLDDKRRVVWARVEVGARRSSTSAHNPGTPWRPSRMPRSSWKLWRSRVLF